MVVKFVFIYCKIVMFYSNNGDSVLGEFLFMCIALK